MHHHTLYRIKIRKCQGRWCCDTGTTIVWYPLWSDALQAANTVAIKWRSHYAGWF